MTDYFISDIHLYQEDKEHPGRLRLHCFLEGLAGQEPGRLWILGDLFDYWFEYRRLLPSGYTSTLCLIRKLTGNGWRVLFIPGNHDWWCGRGLAEATGMEIIHEAVHRDNIQGIECILSHGDGLGKGDTGYRIIRPVLRSSPARLLFSMVHPTIAAWVALRFSSTSRRILHGKVDTVPGYISRWVTDRKDDGVQLAVTGHTHCPSVTDHGGIIHASLGDWISHFTYLTISGGEISLNEYKT